MMNNFKNNRAFSFVEIIIVISIIVLLAIVAISLVDSRQEESNNAKITSDTSTLKNSFLSYLNENSVLPLPGGNNNYFKSDATYAHTGETDIFGVHGYVTETILPKKYLNYLPLDPKTNQFYAYGKTMTGSQELFELSSVKWKNNEPLAMLDGTYPGENGPISLIREYNGPSFISDNSKEHFPYNPEERILTAKITNYTGEVTINGTRIIDNPSMAELLLEGHEIVVPAGGTAEIYFSDGSTSTLGDSVGASTLTLADMSYKNEDNLVTKIKLILTAGTLWTKATNLDEESEFDVFTQDATASVRGTVFGVSRNDTTGETDITLELGKLQVATINEELNNAEEIKELIEAIDKEPSLITNYLAPISGSTLEDSTVEVLVGEDPKEVEISGDGSTSTIELDPSVTTWSSQDTSTSLNNIKFKVLKINSNGSTKDIYLDNSVAQIDYETWLRYKDSSDNIHNGLCTPDKTAEGKYFIKCSYISTDVEKAKLCKNDYTLRTSPTGSITSYEDQLKMEEEADRLEEEEEERCAYIEGLDNEFNLFEIEESIERTKLEIETEDTAYELVNAGIKGTIKQQSLDLTDSTVGGITPPPTVCASGYNHIDDDTDGQVDTTDGTDDECRQECDPGYNYIEIYGDSSAIDTSGNWDDKDCVENNLGPTWEVYAYAPYNKPLFDGGIIKDDSYKLFASGSSIVTEIENIGHMDDQSIEITPGFSVQCNDNTVSTSTKSFTGSLIGISKYEVPGKAQPTCGHNFYNYGSITGISLDNEGISDKLGYQLVNPINSGKIAFEISVRGSSIARNDGVTYTLLHSPGNFKLYYKNNKIYIGGTGGLEYHSISIPNTNSNHKIKLVIDLNNGETTLYIDNNDEILPTTNRMHTGLDINYIYLGNYDGTSQQWNDIIDYLKIYTN